MPMKRWFWFAELFACMIKPNRASRRHRVHSHYLGTNSISLELLENRVMLSGVSVTQSTANMSAAAPEVVISGSGFDPIVSNNTVTFNGGAVGVVTSATADSLTVTFTTEPTAAGNLTAIVTSDSVSSGAAVQVATVIPDISSSTANLPADATTVIIDGYGFDSTVGNNSVTFNNGAAGTVSAATATQLTVSLTTGPTTAGPLNIVVTTNAAGSGSAVQVATVAPVVTSSTAHLAANASSVIIAGLGFDTNSSNDTIIFDNGAVGTVTAATATSLTVSLTTTPTTAGSFSAVVTSNGVSSGVPVQVAAVTPVVTTTSTQVTPGVTTLIISGFGFDLIAANNAVVFNGGAVGTVTSATPTSLSVALSTKPTSAGNLTAVVTTNSLNSGGATQVAAVVPLVTSSVANLAPNATTIVIAGLGFDPTPSNNTVVFNLGAAGTVTAATATALTVTFDTNPTTTGSLTAVVTSNSLASGAAVQVATVKPVATSSTANLAANATTLTISGFGFDATTASNNTVLFSNGAVGTVTSATATALTVSITTGPKTAGSLTAIVTTGGQSSGAAVQVASVTPSISSSTANLAANVSTLTINGFGFDPIVANNSIVFNGSTVGTVTAATATSLIISFSTNSPPTAGNLTVVVTTNTQNSGTAVQVATVTPVVTVNTTNVAANASTITVDGFGFDAVAANNSVVLNNGAVGTIASATATSLTITLTTLPSKAGSLTAIITTNTQVSGSAAQIASVAPVVRANDGNILSASSSTLTIIGIGFDTTAGNNTVVFNNEAVGTVTSATATTLSVSLSTRPTTVGGLSAVVTTNAVGSGNSVQVATVVASIDVNSTALAANASVLTITGLAFDPTPSRNTIVFNNGAVGTVTAATSTSLTVTLSTRPTSSGNLTAIVTTNSQSSGRVVQVAVVTPILTSSVTNLSGNASTLTISGFGFDATASRNVVTFNNGAAGVVTASTATSLTIGFITKPKSGSLTATITSNGLTGSSGVQVATVIPVVVANESASLPANASSIRINGVGFDSTAANNIVTFNNGAVGTVTASTSTSLTVSFSTAPTKAGSLTAVVTTNGLTNGDAVQVATVIPVLTSSASNLAANATTLTINGFGFDATAANNSVVFNDGAVGTVNASTRTSLTVEFSTRPTTAMGMTAIVTSNGVSSGAPDQIASVTPVVSSTTSRIASDVTTMTISGFGFDSIASNNAVTLNDGAVGTVTTATPTSLTVTFSANPAAAGHLTAVVTTNSHASGSAIQVADVVPVVLANSSSVLLAGVTSLTINGTGFDTTAANNSVTFNNGAVGTVSSATATTLNVTLTTAPTSAGNLTAIVTSNSVNSGTAVQVASIVPVVTATSTVRAANATSLTISGVGFNPIAANNTVVFNKGAVGTVTAATSTSLTITLSTTPTSSGNLTAVVTTNSLSSGAAVKVATVIPVVISSTASIAANGATLVINGFGFDTTPGNNAVTLNNGAIGDVTSATATSITVTFSTTPATAGSLTAVVNTGGVSSSAPVQVAKVTPVVTSNNARVAANANTLTINGFGFATTAANNLVAFNNGAVGTVTSATKTSLIVTFSVKPKTAGLVTAVVTTNSLASGTAVQVAALSPVVSSSSINLAANAATLTISGLGFDPIANRNTVVFSGGAAGTVTAATATSLTVTLSTRPTTAGNLTAVVTTNSLSSGTAVQVATVIPTVTSSAANLLASASTLTINGFGFDPVAANNAVTLSGGAVGTVTAATATSLTVSLSTKPTSTTSLTALVTTGTRTSIAAVQVATVVPVVTSSTFLAGISTSIVTINGFGFDAIASRNKVVFNNGATGTVTAATSTSLTVTYTVKPKTAGSVTAIVTTNAVVSGAAVQVAIVKPVITTSVASMSPTSSTIKVNGLGFDPIAGRNTVVFNNGAVGTVSSATLTTLTVTFTTKPTSLGSLTAVVTTNSQSSGTAVQIATVAPAITSSATALAFSANTVTINGFGFNSVAAQNTVTFSNGAVGTVTSATATALTVTFSKKPAFAGILTAIVSTNGVSSGAPVQVAAVAPIITASSASVLATATTMTISGLGFDPVAARNVVTLSNGAIGTVTVAKSTSLTVTFSVKPKTAGSVTAIVTTNGVVSGTAVQVVIVKPVITPATTKVSRTATTMTIYGFGFDPVAAKNTVVFSNGAIGIVTAATPTSLTFKFSTTPRNAGSLTAIVTTNSISTGIAIQIGVVL